MNESRTPFLESVCESVRERHGEMTSKLAIVLPSRRAGLYLRKYLSSAYEKTIICPEILSIDDFVRKMTSIEIEEPVSLIIQLYRNYTQVAGKDAEPFDDFVHWAPTLINDYSDIHLYCRDPASLFKSLNEEKALDLWSPGGEKLSDIQKNYLDFWSMLPELMQSFDTSLASQNRAYNGLAFRLLANRFQNLKEDFELQRTLAGWKEVIWAGFSALSDAEWTILSIMLENEMADAFFDADAWYMKDEVHQAGHFLRELKKKWRYGDFKWMVDLIGKREERSVTVAPVDGDIAQAKICGQLLTDEEAIPDPEKTAVLLPDEKLLIPVLNALPDRIKDANVTMQWPVANTGIHLFLKAVFSFWRDVDPHRSVEGVPSFHLSKLLAQETMGILLKRLAPENSLADYCRKFHSGNVPFEMLNELPDPLPVLLNLYPGQRRGLAALATSLDALRASSEEAGLNEIDRHALDLILEHILEIKEELSKTGWNIDSRSLEMLCDIRIRKSGLSFFGEPLKGLQIMGMLESRALDFDQLIILSCTDDILPGKNMRYGFIPHRIRRAFGLPTRFEKEAVYAYHFYRLLQRSNHVFLIYNNNTSGLQSGEASRLIKQIAVNKPALIETINPVFKVHNQSAYKDLISKTPEVVTRIRSEMERSLSPSAINTLAACPLDYYYRYVLHLQEPERDADIEDGDLGNIVHRALDKLYAPYAGKVLNISRLEKIRSGLESQLENSFSHHGYSSLQISSGKLLLARLIAEEYMKRLIESEIRYCKKYPDRPVTLLGCESQLNYEVQICGSQVRINGKVDRINQIDSIIQILDYKTGGFSSSDIKIKNIDQITAKPKTLQLLTYAYLYLKNHAAVESVECGIIPLRIQSEAVMMQCGNVKQVSEELLTAYEEQLELLISEILDQNIPLQHNEKSPYCVFCK